MEKFYRLQGWLAPYMADTSDASVFNDTPNSEFYRKLCESQPHVIDWVLQVCGVGGELAIDGSGVALLPRLSTVCLVDPRSSSPSRPQRPPSTHPTGVADQRGGVSARSYGA